MHAFQCMNQKKTRTAGDMSHCVPLNTSCEHMIIFNWQPRERLPVESVPGVSRASSDIDGFV